MYLFNLGKPEGEEKTVGSHIRKLSYEKPDAGSEAMVVSDESFRLCIGDEAMEEEGYAVEIGMGHAECTDKHIDR